MAERITWQTCPECGELAAIGWLRVAMPRSDIVVDVAVEFDCPNECKVPYALEEAFLRGVG